jgi:hypothetical protein
LPIRNQKNTATPAISFTVGDAETPNSLVVTAASSNPALVQDSKVLISGTGTSRTVTITPETDQVGLTTITLTVSDGTLTASSSFIVTVYPERGLWLGDDFTYPDGPIIEEASGFWTPQWNLQRHLHRFRPAAADSDQRG